MKKSLKVVTVFCFVFISLLFADNQRYGVKSGIIKYEITTSGKSFGMDIGSKGERSVYFKEWGALELRDEIISQNMMGSREKVRSLMKFDKKSSYNVDFDNKIIIKTDIDKFVNNSKRINAEILKSNSAKKTGTGKVLGYDCDIWSMQGAKIWIYKGVVLKTESNSMGIKTVENAISAKFNISISNDKFILPDFPIKSFDNMIYKDMGNNDEPSNMPSEDEMQKMMKSFSNMIGN